MMISIINRPDWFLDDNGISIVDANGKNLLDLRNDFSIEEVKVFNDKLSLSLNGERETLNLIIQGATNGSLLNELAESKTFEGIYDFNANSLNICIDTKCYLIEGNDMTISIIQSDGKHFA